MADERLRKIVAIHNSDHPRLDGRVLVHRVPEQLAGALPAAPAAGAAPVLLKTVLASARVVQVHVQYLLKRLSAPWRVMPMASPICLQVNPSALASRTKSTWASMALCSAFAAVAMRSRTSVTQPW
jgi:hypothetical protein